MSVEQYSVVAHDWVNLEFIINDLTQRIVGQELHPTSSPTFADMTLTGDFNITGDLDITGNLDADGTITLNDLTASRIVATDAGKSLVSTDLIAWIDGTANKITVSDDSDGSVTLTIPDAVTLVNPTVTGVLDASAGEVRVEDHATVEPTSESDGHVGVAYISSEGRLYFAVEGTTYYVAGTAVSPVSPVTGNPIGLLLALTYS